MRTDLSGAGGIRLAADVDGPEDGPTVVLLHGGGQTRHSWSSTWRFLAGSGWRAWTVDLRGHGDSEWSGDGDYTLQAFAADADAIARSLPRPPVLVGASLGGLASMVAIAGADPQEEVARALVLVDVAHRLESRGTDRIGAFMTGNLDGFASLDEAADAIAAYNPNRPRPKDLSGLAKNLRQGPDGRWRWHWDPRFVSGKFGSSDETRSSVVEPSLLERSAAALQVPTLLVRGRSSDLLSEEGAQEFLARVPHAEFADVAGAGHMVVGDRNDVFNAAVLDFLERHRG
ncbi:alpha/beta fold hydrolase [Dermatobacter hominis]|uniref:alpha/beta fold hydrolase n=1 Tax=Dermatobacter hominis TaxID=2884263 RepID=UPI001D0FF5D1|nr:alpha/beta hydrolase [Dermatobacter hominis]UDY35214.1 alpha/beta hydrolase [Dermatobacter hominis]